MVQKDFHEYEIIELETDSTKIIVDEFYNGHKSISYRPTKEFCSNLQNDGQKIVLAMKKIAKSLNSRKDHHCSNCGSLLPELGIIFGNRLYRFTCYQVESTKTDRILKTTNYQKLHEYTKPEKTIKKKMKMQTKVA